MIKNNKELLVKFAAFKQKSKNDKCHMQNLTYAHSSYKEKNIEYKRVHGITC